MTDADEGWTWVALVPLVEACRPRSKRPPRHLRQTLGGTAMARLGSALPIMLPPVADPEQSCEQELEAWVIWVRSAELDMCLRMASLASTPSRIICLTGLATTLDTPG